MSNGNTDSTARNAGAVTNDLLQAAVDRGIITTEQRDALRALASETGGAAPPGPDRAVSFVQVLYWAGALAVLYALGYFLVDRWKSLQPGGVLGVAVLYAASFAASAVLLSRLGHRLASSLFALLAVGMAPIVTWSLEALAGVWPSRPMPGAAPFTTDLLATIRWIPIELSAALAGLVALRRVPFPLLVLSVSVPVALALVHLTPLVFDPELDFAIWGWVAILAAMLLLLAGAELDRRAPTPEYAAVAYLTALVYYVIGLTGVADQSRLIQHSLPLQVAGLASLAYATRRGLFLGFGGMLFIGYLAFLATDVFETATGFMVVVVAAGAALILGTVIVQRRFPALARSFARDARPRAFRGARRVYAAAAVVALVLVATAPSRARDKLQQRTTRMRENARLSAQSRAARARAQQQPAAARPETAAVARP